MPVSTRREAKEGAKAQPHKLVDPEGEACRQPTDGDLAQPAWESESDELIKQKRRSND